MAEALHRSIGTPARFSPLTIDGTAKVLAASLVGGFPGLSPQPDYDRARLLVYLGVNPVVSHGHSAGMPSPVSRTEMSTEAPSRRTVSQICPPSSVYLAALFKRFEST